MCVAYPECMITKTFLRWKWFDSGLMHHVKADLLNALKGFKCAVKYSVKKCQMCIY